MPYDGRSLYERLKEQKDKKDSDYEETHKLSEFYWGLKELTLDILLKIAFHYRELNPRSG